MFIIVEGVFGLKGSFYASVQFLLESFEVLHSYVLLNSNHI